MYYPSFSDFTLFARRGNLIPVYREILADRETPVSAFSKIDDGRYSFVLESVEGGEKWGRYSFLGVGALAVFRVRGGEVIVDAKGEKTTICHEGDPLRCLRELMRAYRPVGAERLPRFYGGAVGFFSFEMADFFESLPQRRERSFCNEEAVFIITELILIFDNQKHTLTIVANTPVNNNADLATLYEGAIDKIENLADKLRLPQRRASAPATDRNYSLGPNTKPEEFIEKVKRAKYYIQEGDVIQVVLSRRFETSKVADEFDLYRALRFINPSPYMFFLRLDELSLVGSSPEVMVRLTDGSVELRPIAGTRRRGKTEREDRHLADELLRDPKEKAEHVMLVDLGRNDLGKVARVGSVQVNELMVCERYSHVMHLVSHIQAYLEKDKDCFDVVKATFPAGSLTGAPKVRALEIIRELELGDRGPYGGAVGYFGFNGNMDMGITIRTLFIQGETIYLHAGAGIVADSDPEKELEEVDNKIRGMVKALEMAARGLEIGGRGRE